MPDRYPNPHPAFYFMWMLEKALAENDRRRTVRALAGLKKRGFIVRMVQSQLKSVPVATGDLRETDQERQRRALLP